MSNPVTKTQRETLYSLGVKEMVLSPTMCECPMHVGEKSSERPISAGFRVMRTGDGVDSKTWHDVCALEGALWSKLGFTLEDLSFPTDHGCCFTQGTLEIGFLELPELLQTHTSSSFSGERFRFIPLMLPEEGISFFVHDGASGRKVIPDDTNEANTLIDWLQAHSERPTAPEGSAGDTWNRQVLPLEFKWVRSENMSDICSGTSEHALRKIAWSLQRDTTAYSQKKLLEKIVATHNREYENGTFEEEVRIEVVAESLGAAGSLE
jgi:hypothetical protein